MKKWIKRFMIIFLVIFVLIFGGIWFVTTPPTYPYPESPVLGELDKQIEAEYNIETLTLEDDYAGPVTATLYSNPLPDSLNQNKAVLYIPGYGEYFFQYDLGETFRAQGYNFYALDLRKQGRSWLPHQRPGFTKDIAEYYEEMDKAIAQIKAAGNEFLMINGHSMGGLVAALYTKEGNNKADVDALYLNSPFLDWPVKGAVKQGVLMLGMFSAIRSNGGLASPKEPSAYGNSLHKSGVGEWDYSLSYKPSVSFPKYLAWAKAVSDGQIAVKAGLNLELPILVMHSDKSYLEPIYADDYQNSDTVLDVEDIKLNAPQLGKNVKTIAIVDATHDIFTSKEAVRTEAYKILFNWLNALK